MRSSNFLDPNRHALLCLASSLALSAPHAVMAQDSAARTTAFSIEEVLVTARKREERLQDTPVSVTAVTAAELANRFLKDISNVADFTPNLEFSSSAPIGGAGNAAILFMRGVGQTDFLITTDPGVGIFLDGVYVGRSVGGVFDVMDFERIEVLRGPQGTIFGKNTIGGAISLISAKPDENFGGNAQLTIGSRDRIDINGTVNVPLIDDKLMARASFASSDQDGYGRRLSDGLRLGDRNSTSARGTLRWLAAENLEVLLTADGYRQRTDGAAITLGFADPTAQLASLYNAFVAPQFDTQFDNRWITSDPLTTWGTGSTFSDTDVWGVASTIIWDLDAVTIKSITAYRDLEASFARDADGTPMPYVESEDFMAQNQFSQELQFSGKADDGRLNWLVGFYYFRENAWNDTNVNLAVGLFDALEALPGPLFPGGPGGAGNPVNIGLDLQMLNTLNVRNRSYATFVQVSYALTDQLSVSGGVRYTYDKKQLLSSLFHVNANVYNFPPTLQKENWDNFSPKGSIEFKWTEDLMTYASVSRGFKAGGFNGRPVAQDALRPFDPELVTAYEAGIKSEWFDNRLRLNAAYFYTDYKDIQLTIATASQQTGSFIFVTENAAKGRVQGFEVEMLARPLPGLDLSGAVGYTDARYKRLDPGAVITLDTRFPKAPKWNASAAAQYTWPVADLFMASLRGEYSYRSLVFHDAVNSPGGSQTGYSLVNASVSIESMDERWRLTMFGRNLTDKIYMINGYGEAPSFGYTETYYGPPREWGVSLNVRF